MSSVNKQNRDFSLDVIRCLAIFLVISVHFFLNSGYYDVPVYGKTMFVLTVIRSNCMICVPLFLLLSGYLMGGKTVSKKYYLGIKRVLAIYLLASIFALIYKQAYLGQEYTLKSGILSILDFSAADYSWYVEMYIGLFLMIPFLNIIYNNLNSKKQKLLLIGSLLLLTGLPGVLNTFDLYTEGFFKNPSTAVNFFTPLIPDWWEDLYPFTYYFAGRYLKEYGINVKLRYRIPLFLACGSLVGIYNFYRSFGTKFVSAPYAYFPSALNLLLAVLFFSIVKDIKFRKPGERVARVFALCSDLSLGAYLVSSVFDNFFYENFKKILPAFENRVYYAPLIVLVVFLSSLIASFVLNMTYNAICAVCSGIKNLVTKKRPQKEKAAS